MKRLMLAAVIALPFFMNAQENEKPLSPKEAAKENAATAIEEKEVAQEKSEAEIALEQGKEIVVKDTTHVYTATSVADNSGFARTVGFDGIWKIDLNLDKKELVITGGTLNNKSQNTSNKLRLMVYFAEKPFDVKNPDLIGAVYSSIDVDPLEAGAKKAGQSYVTQVALETPPTPGKYYPYILLGEQNLQTQEFEVKDVKVFQEFVTLP